jgi:hypothetical protein
MTDTPTQTLLLNSHEMIDLQLKVPEMLEDSLSADAVRKLTGLCGGTATHIPQTLRMALSVVAQQLSDPITQWLNKTYGAGQIQIPIGPHSCRAIKMAAFLAALGCHVRTDERAKRELVTAGFR